MTTSRSSAHPFILISVLAAVSCTALAAGARSSQAARTVTPSGHADALFRARTASASAVQGSGLVRPAEAGVKLIAPIAVADTFLPGALLDVWLYNRAVDVRTGTSGPSVGQAVVRGDFFRFNSVLADANLRGLWGQPLLLKWSAYLQITKQGEHVFLSELAERERNRGSIYVRTLVRLNDETLFEDDAREHLTHLIHKTGMRSLTLTPGRYRLEIWLGVHNVREPSPQLGTYLSMREPGLATAVPIEAWRISHLPGQRP